MENLQYYENCTEFQLFWNAAAQLFYVLKRRINEGAKRAIAPRSPIDLGTTGGM